MNTYLIRYRPRPETASLHQERVIQVLADSKADALMHLINTKCDIDHIFSIERIKE